MGDGETQITGRTPERPTGTLLHRPYFFFFPPGITLATALAIDPATVATTPFFEPRFFELDLDPDDFFAELFDFELLLRVLDADCDLDPVFFFLAVLAMTDCVTALRF